MASSLKCLDIKTGKNKCPDKPGDKKFYCDTTTGKCYSATNSGKPWGFDKKASEKSRAGEHLVYDEELKIFGYQDQIDKHKKMFAKAAANHQGLYNPVVLNSMSLDKLKDIANNLGIHFSKAINVKGLVSKILKAQAANQIEKDFQDIAEVKTSKRRSTDDKLNIIGSLEPLNELSLQNITLDPLVIQSSLKEPSTKLYKELTPISVPTISAISAITPITPITPHEEKIPVVDLAWKEDDTNINIREYIPIVLLEIRKELKDSFSQLTL